MRHINEKGLAIIKESETCKLTMYICPGGKKTIGWGHVLPDDTDIISIPQSLADGWLREDIEKTEEQLAVATQHIILTDNQWSALVSFCFNVGIGNFLSSTMRRKLNAGDYEGAADEFGKWVYAKGKKLAGLVKRREKEKSLFLEEY